MAFETFLNPPDDAVHAKVLTPESEALAWAWRLMGVFNPEAAHRIFEQTPLDLKVPLITQACQFIDTGELDSLRGCPIFKLPGTLLNEEVLAKGETIFREDASGKWVFLMALRAAINECIHFLDPKQLPALYDSLQDAHAGWALVIADHKECPKEIWPRMANHPSYVIRQRLCRDPDEDIPLSVFLQLLNDKETSVVGAAQRFLLWAHQINCFMPFGVRPPGDPQWMLWPEVYEFSQVEKPIGRKPPRPVLVSEASVKSGWLGLLCTAGAERVQGGLSPTRWELISAQPACPDNKIRYWPSRIGWLPGLKLPAFPPTNPPSLDHPETVYPRLEVLAGARRFVLWSCIPDGPGLAWSETGVADTGLDPAEGVESLGLDWCNDIPFKEDILRGLRQIGAQQLSL